MRACPPWLESCSPSRPRTTRSYRRESTRSMPSSRPGIGPMNAADVSPRSLASARSARIEENAIAMIANNSMAIDVYCWSHGSRAAALAAVEWQSQGCSNQHRSDQCGDAPFSGRDRRAKAPRTLEKAVDRLASAGWLSYRPGRLDGQLCRAAPGRIAGWHRDHRGDGQFPGEPSDGQIAVDALVTTRRRSSAPDSLRSLQRHARLRLRTEISSSQRSTPASGDRGLTTPNVETVPPSPP